MTRRELTFLKPLRGWCVSAHIKNLGVFKGGLDVVLRDTEGSFLLQKHSFVSHSLVGDGGRG